MSVNEHLNTIRKSDWLILFPIIVIGAALRLLNLGKESLEHDEIDSVLVGQQSLGEILLTTNVNPPLYHVLIHFWIKFFGTSEFSVRFPSFIFGVTTIFLCYIVGKALFSGKVGLIAAAFIALSRFHLYYSQEARVYAVGTVLTLLSMYCFILLTERPKRHLYCLYAFSSVLLLYAHVYGIFIIAAQNIYVFASLFLPQLFKNRAPIRFWIFSQLSIILLFAPWYYHLFGQVVRIQGGFWIEVNWLTPLKIFQHMAGGYGGYLGSLLYSLLILRLIAVYFNSPKMRHRFWLLALWLSVSILIPFIVSYISQPILFVRYTLFASIALYLLAAWVITDLRQKHLARGIVVLVCTLSFASIIHYHTETHKLQWKEAIALFEEQANSNDLLLSIGSTTSLGLIQQAFTHYSSREDIVKKNLSKNQRSYSYSLDSELQQLLKKHARVWIISINKSAFKELFLEMQSSSFEYTYCEEFETISVYLFTKKSDENRPKFDFL